MLASQSFLGGVFDRAATILCGSDAVMDPVTGWIITPLPHNIAQLLTSPHLNYNHSICYPWRLCTYCCVHWEWRAQILICFGSHIDYFGSCGVPSDTLGWWMARWAPFSHNQGVAHPWISINELLNKLSQFLLCTKWIDEGLFDCHGVHHSKVATERREHLPGGRVSPFGNNPARLMSSWIASNRLHPGTPVDLFFNAVPPRRCPLLFLSAAIVVPRRWVLATTRPQRWFNLLQIHEILSATNLM